MFEVIVGTTDDGYLETGKNWRDGTWRGGYDQHYRAHPPGLGGKAIYSFFGLGAIDWEISTHWVVAPPHLPWRTSKVSYEIFDSSYPIGNVEVDQSQEMDGFWFSLGSRWRITSGVMRVVISSHQDSWVVADGMRLTLPARLRAEK